MAIQNRRGSYTNFDPEKMVSGEFAVVRDGDPNSSTGRSVYLCFEPGVVKRLADYEDIRDMVADVAEEYIQDFDDAVSALTTLIPDTEQAKDDATAAAEAANEAAEAASAVVQAGNDALGHAFGICSTSRSTDAKVVSIDGFQLAKGGLVAIQFTQGSSIIRSLNINNTGAKQIKRFGSTDVNVYAEPGEVLLFQYDGTYFEVVSSERRMPFALTIESISSLPVTKYLNGIKENMVCAGAVLSTPSAQTDDWTVTTSNGSVTINGSISGTTSLTMVLVPSVVYTAS